jgi:hypothetical protein
LSKVGQQKDQTIFHSHIFFYLQRFKKYLPLNPLKLKNIFSSKSELHLLLKQIQKTHQNIIVSKVATDRPYRCRISESPTPFVASKADAIVQPLFNKAGIQAVVALNIL